MPPNIVALEQDLMMAESWDGRMLPPSRYACGPRYLWGESRLRVHLAIYLRVWTPGSESQAPRGINYAAATSLPPDCRSQGSRGLIASCPNRCGCRPSRPADTAHERVFALRPYQPSVRHVYQPAAVPYGTEVHRTYERTSPVCVSPRIRSFGRGSLSFARACQAAENPERCTIERN
jgi:hypothetical protein